ncbi:hypothetical protein FK220_006125 [Flavobacteriaceae bacterium TP-CH-4]|uniref:Lipoprotein n=1 Tax=Pelagihabitans pacificus TaxID=2696054 RepID=A0A967E4Z7_9FLAO|nr:hypothetical protein [Pelagihabitans pacificus]NHF58907.1 hypothetical protein [Pelagihabitans pacificus]
MRNTVFGIALLLLLLGCNGDDDSTNIDCSASACTNIFISHTVTVTDPSGVAIPLDAFSVTDLDTGEDLTRTLTEEELEQARQAGRYPLYDDLTDRDNFPISRSIVFKGFIDEKEVIRAEYSAGTDCCHSSVSGNLNLIVE